MFHISTDLGTWVAVFFTLAVFSFLYKDNPFYKIAEYTVVGVSVGYILAVSWHDAFIPYVITPLKSHESFGTVIKVIIPSILGIMMLSSFVPKYEWLSRYPIAFTIGMGSGMAIPPTIETRVLSQIQGTIMKINLSTFTTFAGITALLVLIGTLTSLIYFYFSKEHKGATGFAAKIGIWFLMIGFGATFGFTVMARISLFIGRIQFLLYDWLGYVAK